MVKLIIGLLILVIAVLLAVMLVQDDPGFVLIKYGDFSLETSLAFGIVAVVGGGIAIQVLIRLLLAVWRLPSTLSKQAENRRFEKGRKLLNKGLIDLAEGRFEQSESNLLKMIDYAENPLLNYLAAARAAQQLSKFDERDNYLKAAHDAKPEAEIAIGVTQAELQLASCQTERALATLTHLRSVAPKHDYVLKLLARIYFKIEEWQLLCELLPEVRKKKLFKDDQLQQLELKAYIGCLDCAASSETTSLEKTWAKIPKVNQNNVELLLHYLELVQRNNQDTRLVEQLIVKSINQQWNTRLIDYYGRLQVEDVTSQLATAEKWLQDYGSSDVLLLALGRICIRLKLWGKAQSYLDASVGLHANPQTSLALAELLSREELGDAENASRYFRQGLKLCQQGKQ
jgi:HemY protein